jgi:uncharacterized protein YuzE
MAETLVLEVDHTARAAYVRFSAGPIVRTVEHGDSINIDLDRFGVVVGIEVLDLAAELPFQVLVTQYHVDSRQVDLLRLLRPSISGFVARVTPDRQPVESDTTQVQVPERQN